ncbi:hypothetical protein [Endozoicomonas sp. 8E]|uniref:hypothetical protein n=1 Tax=Endozoicomonas sp. 8E TaxID=3035692 RepID=UPI002939151F|nr:hypothetical protein [Endozoicomonas sp. 8E]WOG30057.1 hypothetical protein P6910_10500 [Endozoicomonas sp. 8E]
MLLFRGSLLLFLSLIAAASSWSSVESIAQKAKRNAEKNLNNIYFNYVFAKENERLLKAMMVSVRRIYDLYEPNQWPQDLLAPDNQKEARQQFLTRLVQKAARHTIAKVNDELDSDPDRPMFHLLQAFNSAPVMKESQDVVHWSQTYPVMLQGVLAEDRLDSMESLIEEAVQNSFREFPSNPLSPEQLARQLGFILLEMQELFLRGRALRLLSFKVDKQKQNPQIARDPAFNIYLNLLTEDFNNHPTLWHIYSKPRDYQENLSALFMEAADRQDYGIEWYQQVRRILDGEKLVSKKQVIEKPIRQNLQDDNNWERWFKIGVIASASVMVIGMLASLVVDQYQTKWRRLERQQEKKLQKKLGRALNKPWRKDPKGRDWTPSRRDRKQVRDIIEGFDRKIWEKVMIRAGVLDPHFCDMDLDDLYMQWSLTELYGHLRQEQYIWTREDTIRHEREQEEAAERARAASCTATSHQQNEWNNSFLSNSGFSWDSSDDDDGFGFSSWDTPTTLFVQGLEASWD